MLVLATFQRDLGYRSALKPEWDTPVPAPSGNVVGPYLRRIMWIIQIWWLSPFTQVLRTTFPRDFGDLSEYSQQILVFPPRQEAATVDALSFTVLLGLEQTQRHLAQP